MADDPGTPHRNVVLGGDVDGVVVAERSRYRCTPEPSGGDVAEALPRSKDGAHRLDPADVGAGGSADAVDGCHEVTAPEPLGADACTKCVTDGEGGLAERDGEWRWLGHVCEDRPLGAGTSPKQPALWRTTLVEPPVRDRASQ